jgi:hypothetical protein
MKRYKRLFKENYLTTVSIENKPLDVYINPTPKERKEMMEGNYDMRGLLNENGHLLLWRNVAIHRDVIISLKNNSDFKRLYKGNHESYEDRNYITVIIKTDGTLLFGDGEEIDEIRENDDLDLRVLVHNTEKKHPWVKFSKEFNKI